MVVFFFFNAGASLVGSVGCACDDQVVTGSNPPGRSDSQGFDPHQVRQHSFVEIDHEIFSTVILSLLLIKEEQLSVSGKNVHKYHLED